MLLALLAMSPAVAYLGGGIGLGVVSDADHLMLAELLPSLADGVSLSGWTIPLANYAIPDWPLYVMALAAGHTPTATVAWFMTFQAALFLGAVSALVRSLRPASPPSVTLLAAAPTFLFVVLGVRPAAYLASSFNHVGTQVLTVGAIAVTIRWLGENRPVLVMASGALAFVATFSDRIFVFWFLVPAATAVVVLAATRRLHPRQAIRWLLVHLAAAGAALPAAGLVFPQRSPYSISFGAGIPTAGITSYVSSVVSTVGDAVTLSLAVAISLVALLVQLVRRRTLSGGSLPADVALFLGVLVLALVPSVSLATSLLGAGVGAHMRHYMVLFLLPLLLGPLVAALHLEPSAGGSVVGPRRLGERTGGGWPHRLLSIVLIAPLVLIGLRLPSMAAGFSSDRSPVPVGCLEDALGRSTTGRGIASYWDARPIEVFTEGRLDMASYGPDLLPDRTNADLTEFDHPTYDFAVTSAHIVGWELPLGRLVTLSGPPLRQATCGPFTISDWGPSGLRLSPVDRPGDIVEISGCELPSELAAPSGSCTLAIGADPPPGFLSYGPYIGLLPGTYEARLRVRSIAPAEVVVGAWDLIIDGATGEPADAGPIGGTDGRWTDLVVPIVIPADAARSIVEVRVDPSQGPMEIAELTIERRS